MLIKCLKRRDIIIVLTVLLTQQEKSIKNQKCSLKFMIWSINKIVIINWKENLRILREVKTKIII